MSTSKVLIQSGIRLRPYWRILQISQRNFRQPERTSEMIWTSHPGGSLPNRHVLQKFWHMRWRKFIKVDLDNISDYDKNRQVDEALKGGPEEIRRYMKKQGIPPSRPYRDRGRDRPIHVSSTGGIIEEYVPAEGDGRASRLTREGVGQLWDNISSKSKELVNHVRKIRRYDEDFDPKSFGETVAMPVFIDAHTALMDRDIDRLHELVTEHAFTIMYEENRLRSIRWELVESIEPARVVHVRAAAALHDDNIFGQVTVRLHTKQKLAIYDQFGRLYLGSNDVARDVLEYVVFERHLVDPYGMWRMHAKIVPKWIPPKDAVIPTFRKREEAKRHDVGDDVKVEEFIPIADEGDKPEKPALSTS